MLLLQLHSRGVFATCEELVHWPSPMIVDQEYNELCCEQVCAYTCVFSLYKININNLNEISFVTDYTSLVL
jgi:hypothetical protein